MIRELEIKKDEIEKLCTKHSVRRLEVFGSSVKGRFDHETSDLDFLVDFLPIEPGEHASAYLGLLEDLETLFARDVDLLEAGAVRNPYFLREINQSRKVIYAKRSPEVSA